MSLQVTIVDDDVESAAYINGIIVKTFPGKFTITVFNQPNDALMHLKQKSTDLLITDIQMPEMTGIDLAKSAQGQFRRVLFVSAHDHYALQAIKLSALDYVIKPFVPQDIADAVAKFIDEIRLNDAVDLDRRQRAMIANLANANPKIAINQQDKLWLIDVNDIVHLEADHIYSVFVLRNREKVVASKPLNFYEEVLPDDLFIRVHRSFVINKSFVVAYLKETNELQMNSGIRIPVSRNRKDWVLEKVFNTSGG